MKKFLILFLSLTIISCSFERKPGSVIQFVSKSDTTCLKEIAEAKKEINNGKLTYCHYTGNISFNYLRSQKEMVQILEKFNIKFQNESSRCVIQENQTEHCYCELMKEKIIEKHGEKFVDSLLNISDIQYLKNHENDTLYYADCDKRPNYPRDNDDSEDEYSEVMQREIDNAIVYPKGYIETPNYDVSAFADVSFYVNKKGEAKITSFWFLFDIKSNYKYEKYFENELSRIIKKTEWNPAQIRKQNVNSNMVMRYAFK
jgi:hypothetical protein